MKASLLVVVVLCGLLAPAAAEAQAWVPEPGAGYLKLWTKWLPGSGYKDGNGNRQSYGDYHELYVATYGEIGLIDRLALNWSMDLLRSAYLQDPRDGEGQWHASIGDPALGVRFALLREGRLVMSLSADVRAPLAPSGSKQPFVYSDGTVAGQLTLGAGVWDLAARYAVGYGFDHWYMQASGGYVGRTNDFNDVIVFTAEVGVSGWGWGGRLRATGNIPIANGGAPFNESPSGIGNDVSYVGAALEGDYELREGWFLGLVIEGGIAAIRRQTGGPVISVYGAHAF